VNKTVESSGLCECVRAFCCTAECPIDHPLCAEYSHHTFARSTRVSFDFGFFFFFFFFETL